MSYNNIIPDECHEEVDEELWNYVRERDNDMCQHPDCGGPGHECHHIVYRSHGGRHKASNLIWLCGDHHYIEHNRKAYSRKYFLNKVKLNELKLRERLV